MGMTAMTALVLSVIMMKSIVVMIIKINSNDNKINKLATQAAFVGCKEQGFETAGFINCEKCLD
jgi:hypothetical protein